MKNWLNYHSNNPLIDEKTGGLKGGVVPPYSTVSTPLGLLFKTLLDKVNV